MSDRRQRTTIGVDASDLPRVARAQQILGYKFGRRVGQREAIRLALQALEMVYDTAEDARLVHVPAASTADSA